MAKSVLQAWVMELTLAEQGTLLTAVRGPDNIRKEHPVKLFVRAYRRAILNSARPLEASTFMHPAAVLTLQEVHTCLGSSNEESYGSALRAFWESQIDEIAHHHLLHFAHCAEIVGYRCPDSKIRIFWLDVYLSIVHSFHMKPESKDEMTHRLRDRGCY